MAEVRLSRRAVSDLDATPPKVARRMTEALERLATDPRDTSLDVKVLVGKRPWRRLRVGDHRILFRLSDRGKVLLVARIIDRKELERAVMTLPD